MLSIGSFIIAVILKPFSLFRTLSLKKKISVIFVITIVFFLLYQQFFKTTQTSYTTAEVKKDTITEVVSETGTIAANGRTDVYSPTNGVITEVFIRNGDTVKVGQQLFTIRSSATEQEKAQAYANYLAAKNALDTANATLHTLQAQLFAANQAFINGKGNTNDPIKDDPNYIQQNATWLAAEANYKKQQAVIAQAQTALTSANLSYQATQNTTVKATADGTISNLSVTNGSAIKANLLTSPTRPLATIANLETAEAVVSLSESDIAKVAEGQQTTIEVNAIHDKLYNGIVQRVDTIGTDEQGVTRYNVYIEITNPDTNLRPGMNADVSITTKKLTNVLSVPNSAVKPYQGKRAVRVPGEKGEVKFIPVVIGVKGEKKTEIRSGIQEGQLVITSLSNEQLKRPGLFGN